MAIGPARMPLMDHLGELRMRIVRVLWWLLVAILILYVASPAIGQFLLIPIAELLPQDAAGLADLQAIDPFESFSVRFKIATWSAVVATSPMIMWQILAFFLPALKPNERKWFIPTFMAAVVLFVAGTVFCYFIVLRPAFGWLVGQAAGLGTVIPRMGTYISMIINFELGFGLAFELPLVIFYLVVFNIVPYQKLRGAWRVVYTVLIVASAMITPDASPVTMIILFIALIALYEVSLLLARIVLNRRIRKQEEEEERDLEEMEGYFADVAEGVTSLVDSGKEKISQAQNALVGGDDIEDEGESPWVRAKNKVQDTEERTVRYQGSDNGEADA